MSVIEDEIEVVKRPDHLGHAIVTMEMGDHVVSLDLVGNPETLQPFVVTSVSVTTGRDEGMTSRILREIPVEWCRGRAVRALIGPMPTLSTMAGSRPDSETLRAVLHTYRIAEMHAAYPVPEVQKRFDIPKSTATRWIARAREENTHER